MLNIGYQFVLRARESASGRPATRVSFGTLVSKPQRLSLTCAYRSIQAIAVKPNGELSAPVLDHTNRLHGIDSAHPSRSLVWLSKSEPELWYGRLRIIILCHAGCSFDRSCGACRKTAERRGERTRRPKQSAKQGVPADRLGNHSIVIAAATGSPGGSGLRPC